MALLLALPVMIAARLVKAQQRGFGAAFMSAFLGFLFDGLIQAYTSNAWLGLAVSFLIFPFFFMLVLGTTLLRGLLVSLCVMPLLALLLAVVLFALGGGHLSVDAIDGLLRIRP